MELGGFFPSAADIADDLVHIRDLFLAALGSSFSEFLPRADCADISVYAADGKDGSKRLQKCPEGTFPGRRRGGMNKAGGFIPFIFCCDGTAGMV